MKLWIPGSRYAIFGGGRAATNAANVALGLNAKVIIIELIMTALNILKICMQKKMSQ
ncbi:hypothetical protein ACVPOW_04135 [Staphylococcus aureus]